MANKIHRIDWKQSEMNNLLHLHFITSKTTHPYGTMNYRTFQMVKFTKTSTDKLVKCYDKTSSKKISRS